jgi:hypothetical protein
VPSKHLRLNILPKMANKMINSIVADIKCGYFAITSDGWQIFSVLKVDEAYENEKQTTNVIAAADEACRRHGFTVT